MDDKILKLNSVERVKLLEEKRIRGMCIIIVYDDKNESANRIIVHKMSIADLLGQSLLIPNDIMALIKKHTKND